MSYVIRTNGCHTCEQPISGVGTVWDCPECGSRWVMFWEPGLTVTYWRPVSMSGTAAIDLVYGALACGEG